jgi:hypothetical protein
MSARTAKFLARIDAHLPTLTLGARKSFLAQQIAGWEFRYENFQLTDGASEPVKDRADPPQAADFLLTITQLEARLAAVKQAISAASQIQAVA